MEYRQVTAYGADKDGEIQLEITLRVPKDFSVELARRLGLMKIIPEVARYGNLHLSTGRPEQWTLWVREKQVLPWEKYLQK